MVYIFGVGFKKILFVVIGICIFSFVGLEIVCVVFFVLVVIEI